MLFSKTPLSVFPKNLQSQLASLEKRAIDDMDIRGQKYDRSQPFSHFAHNEMFDPEIFYDEEFSGLFSYQNIEFLAAYVHDVDQSLGYDPFMVFAADFEGDFTPELCFERSKGGVSSLLSRMRIGDESLRHELTMAILKWNNQQYLVLNDQEPGLKIQALHMDIVSRFLDPEAGISAPAGISCLPSLREKSPFKDVFLNVLGGLDQPFCLERYRKGIEELVDKENPSHSLNNLVPHLMYDPIVLMCSRGDTTTGIIDRMLPAFNILIETMAAPPAQKHALFEQMIYNVFSLYPERLAELNLGSSFEFGNHVLLRNPGELMPLTRILAGPLGVFANDLQMDVDDAFRRKAVEEAGIHNFLALVDSHLARTPVAAYLPVSQNPEDLALLDYHLSKGKIHSESIHFGLKWIQPLFEKLSKPAQASVVIGEIDFWMDCNDIASHKLHKASRLTVGHPYLKPLIANHLENKIRKGFLDDKVSKVAQALEVLNGDLLRTHDLGRRAVFRDALMGQDLGL